MSCSMSKTGVGNSEHMNEHICWRFAAQYSTELTAQRKTFHDGQLEYYPALKKARLLDAQGQLIEESWQVNAIGLFPGGEFTLERTFVTIMADNAGIQGETPDENITTMVNRDVEDADTRRGDKLRGEGEPVKSFIRTQYDILYTRDKLKKTKTWHDGWLDIKEEGLVTFHDDETNSVLHRKKITSLAEIAEGSIFESASFVFEILHQRAEMRDAVRKKANVDREAEEEATETLADNIDNIKSGKCVYEVLYSTDLIRKAKRWKDGRVEWNATNCQAQFVDEEGKDIYRRKLLAKDLFEGNELKSGQYVFQIGSLAASPKDLNQGGECGSLSKSTNPDPCDRAPLKPPIRPRKQAAKPPLPTPKVRDDKDRVESTAIQAGRSSKRYL